MKNIILIIIVFLNFQVFFGQTRKEVRKAKELEKELKIQKLVEKEQFVFKVQNATTYKGRMINNLSGYDLQIDHDSVKVYLPFFGRSFTSSFSSEGGIELEGLMVNKTVNKIKKGYRYSFEAEDENHKNHQFRLEIGSSGYTTLDVQPVNKSSISFYGTLDGIESN